MFPFNLLGFLFYFSVGLFLYIMFKHKSKDLLVKDPNHYQDNRTVYDLTDEEIHHLVDYLISISAAANIYEDDDINTSFSDDNSSDQTITLENYRLYKDNIDKEEVEKEEHKDKDVNNDDLITFI